VASDRRPAPLPGPHLLLYDGVCGLCNRLIQSIVSNDRRGIVHFAALQSAVGGEYLARTGAPRDLTTFVLVPNYQSGHDGFLTKGDAALFLFAALGWPWRLLGAGRLLPRPWRNRIYDYIARHRYGVFGQVDHCELPDPAVADRFLDLRPGSTTTSPS
jgi:predicted DCC family thiol-disulfide oxidoreductase YuxK